MWRNNKFLHNCQDFTILHICHVKKSEIPLHFSDFSPFAMYRNLKFLHMTDFSPHVSHVNYVTNMRYAEDGLTLSKVYSDDLTKEHNKITRLHLLLILWM